MAAAQARPQAPQSERLVRVSTSQPLAGLPSQSAKPALQEATRQAPATQAGVALAGRHTLPQAPQLVALVVTLVSQPLPRAPSQSAKPDAQVMRQTPAAHEGAPLVLLHTVGQAPQCRGSVPRFTSQPLEGLPSQSA